MGERPRDGAPGIHHVIVKSAGPIEYYTDHIDRLDWLRRFVRVLDRYGWKCIVFCQMTTHAHMLVDVPDWSLSTGMQRLSCGYGKEFNARHDRSGALLGKRFWSAHKTEVEAVVAAFQYIVLNPVRAGICDRAEEWYWSSFATSCGLASIFPFVDASAVVAALATAPEDTSAALLALVGDVSR